MIARLVGTVVGRDGSRVVVDVRDVGYAVYATLRDIDAWQRAEQKVTLHISTDVREDAIVLFGFSSDVDRVAFERLREVTGVGPKVALACLDALGREKLVQAVADDDVRALSLVPGVGKKLAQRLALELKGKLPVVFGEPSVAVPEVVAPSNEPDPLVLALAQWGYSRAEIARALAKLEADGLSTEAALPTRLSAALRALAS
jgi:Holliday junction DNA helicase RuvA